MSTAVHQNYIIDSSIGFAEHVTSWWGRVTFTSANSGRSIGRSPSSPRTPWWGHWSWHASTTVTDFLAEHRSVSSAVIWRPTGSRTTDSVALSNKQCSRSDPHRTALAWHSIKSNFQVVRARISMPPWSAPTYFVRYFTQVKAIAWRSHLRSAASGSVICTESEYLNNWP